MDLTDQQKAQVSEWMNQGASLADVQKRLETEFHVRMTYMDLRFLVDDLGLEIKAPAPVFNDPKPTQALGPPPSPGGGVSVTLDKLSRPDALVSGQVTFSDGVRAQWHLDQLGRLSLDASQPGYQPSGEDLQAFQMELRKAVEKSGF